MDFRHPFLAVAPTLDGDVLSALAKAEMELSGREIAKRAGRGSPEGIRRVADRLVEQGILTRRSIGSAHLYGLNREHLAARYIEGIAGLRAELIERLRKAIGEWALEPSFALLFGSVARGSAGARSDIDILIVRPSAQDPEDDRWRTQLLELQQSATAWTGNDTRVVEYAEHELDQIDHEPLLDEVLEDGIELYGERRRLRRLIGSGLKA
jgi:predicted nucleotidyltransferase